MISVRHVLIVGSLAFALGGCFRPLYGSAEFGGLQAQQGLAGVAVDVKGDRLAHYLRNELEFNLRGGNPTVAAQKYTLTVNASARTGGAIVDRLTGVAEGASLFLDASYRLTEVGKTATVTEGSATIVVNYERSIQRFANTRAARDAEITGARQLADQIRSRVASYLATGNR